MSASVSRSRNMLSAFAPETMSVVPSTVHASVEARIEPWDRAASQKPPTTAITISTMNVAKCFSSKARALSPKKLSRPASMKKRAPRVIVASKTNNGKL